MMNSRKDVVDVHDYCVARPCMHACCAFLNRPFRNDGEKAPGQTEKLMNDHLERRDLLARDWLALLDHHNLFDQILSFENPTGTLPFKFFLEW